MPYSRTDRTVSLYSKSSVALSKNLTLRNIASFPLAFKTVVVICFSQSSVEESHSPKWRCWCTLVTKLSFNINGGELKRYFFL